MKMIMEIAHDKYLVSSQIIARESKKDLEDKSVSI